MKVSERTKLTAALRDPVAKIAADLRAKIRAPGAIRIAAEQLHKDERVAEDFEVWTDLLEQIRPDLEVLGDALVLVELFGGDADGAGRTYLGAQIGGDLRDWVAKGGSQFGSLRDFHRWCSARQRVQQ